MVKKAKDNDWLDLNTRAIFLEFTVYNPNVNLFASSVLLIEFLSTGGATARAEVKVSHSIPLSSFSRSSPLLRGALQLGQRSR